MTETGLLVAQIVFLVLLFGFIASIVRSSARQLSRVQPPPVVRHGPVVDPPRAAGAAPAPAAPPVGAEPAPVAPPAPVNQPTLEPFPSPFRDLDARGPAEAAEAPTIMPAALGVPDAPEAPATSGEDGAPDDAAAEPFDILAAGNRGADQPLMDLTANIQPRLVVESSPALEAGSDLELEGGLTIGRSGAADLALADQYVSHMHARILRRGAYYFVEDLGSTNGTFLNDLRVESSAQLKVHDTLRMGQTVLRYEE
ncbi:MAG: FHA domain-containing protein [Thermoleophilia bacterium]|jgi:hypothetical protein